MRRKEAEEGRKRGEKTKERKNNGSKEGGRRMGNLE